MNVADSINYWWKAETANGGWKSECGEKPPMAIATKQDAKTRYEEVFQYLLDGGDVDLIYKNLSHHVWYKENRDTNTKGKTSRKKCSL